MNQRGKILRDTSTGPGLVSIAGRQYPFTLEGVWQSEQAPSVNMTVDALIDEAGQLVHLRAVSDSQLAREATDEALAAVKQRGNALVARFGARTLGAMGLLAVAWFFLNTITVQVSSNYKVGISLWKMLGLINAPGGMINSLGGTGASAGLYGVVAVLALLAPMAPYFLRDPRAHLANLLPLVFMVVLAIGIYMNISDGISQAQGAASMFGGKQAADIASELVKEALKAVSIGLGGYLSVLVSLYLAATGVIGWTAAKR